MDDDFDNDVDLGEGNLDDSLGDLGDLGGDTADVEAEPFASSERGGTRSSGGARANARLTEPEPAAVRAPRPPAPETEKAGAPATGEKTPGTREAPEKA